MICTDKCAKKVSFISIEKLKKSVTVYEYSHGPGRNDDETKCPVRRAQGEKIIYFCIFILKSINDQFNGFQNERGPD